MAVNFLSLPLEVRLSIYERALPYSIDYKFDPTPTDQRRLPPPALFIRQRTAAKTKELSVQWFPGVCPNLLFVNRQIYEEASELLYTQNAFEIFVKHPQEPRLPMNEGPADEDSFVLIAWKQRHWCHPRNPKLPLSMILSHPGMTRARRWRVNLPLMDTLIGVDIYMRNSSDAAFRGITKWEADRANNGGLLNEQEARRMQIIERFKEPLDQTARFLKSLSRIDQLGLTFPLGRMDLNGLEYLLESFLTISNAAHVRCYAYLVPYTDLDSVEEHHTKPTIDKIEQCMPYSGGLDPPKIDGRMSDDAIKMLRFLNVIRCRQLTDAVPNAIPA